MKNADEIKKILDIDPLSEAEKITGKSYKEDEQTSNLGFLNHILVNEQKRKILKEAGDTQFSNTIEDYLRIVTGFGFEVIYQESFTSTHKNDDGKYPTEQLYVLYHYKYGILLQFDTFWGNVNSGKYWYNWSPNDRRDNHNCTSSGSFIWNKEEDHIALFDEDFNSIAIPNYPKSAEWNGTWEEFRKLQDPIDQEQKRLIDQSGGRVVYNGYHDCREAVITNITRMLNYGKFVPNWIEKPSAFWFMAFADWDNNKDKQHHDADAISLRRMSKFPIEVQQRIKGRA